MKRICILVFLWLLAVSAFSQQTNYTLFKYRSFIPEVNINDRSVALQAAVYPDLYKTRSAEADMKWVGENDSLVQVFWKQKGDTVLHILTELAGIEWRETQFEIYLVRHFPTTGSPDPAIVPFGGIGTKGLLEEIPKDDRFILNMVFQLARRLLSQAERSAEPKAVALTQHPLMRPTALRRDNLAMLLALVCCQNVMGYEKANEAFESDFWDRHFPSKVIFVNYLMNKWVVTPDKPLASKILAEPKNSDLVDATRPPRLVRPPSTDGQPITQIAGISPTGKLGFSIRYETGNALVIDTIDSYRLAYANGLRSGDQIKRVEGQMVRTFRDLVERILKGLERGGAEIEFLRNNKVQMLTLQYMALPVREEEHYYLDETGDSGAGLDEN